MNHKIIITSEFADEVYDEAKEVNLDDLVFKNWYMLETLTTTYQQFFESFGQALKEGGSDFSILKRTIDLLDLPLKITTGTLVEVLGDYLPKIDNNIAPLDTITEIEAYPIKVYKKFY